MAEREYKVYEEPGGGTMIRIEDSALPFLAFLARTLPGEFNRSLRHVGWWLRGEIKRGMAAGAPGGKRWADLAQVSKERALDLVRKKTLKSGRSVPYRRQKYGSLVPGGRLLNAIGYKHDRAGMRVQVGWLSASAARLGKLFQSKYQTPVTARMRRYWNVAGKRLGKGPIEHPARETIKPAFEAAAPKIPQMIRSRIGRYLEKGAARANAQSERTLGMSDRQEFWAKLRAA